VVVDAYRRSVWARLRRVDALWTVATAAAALLVTSILLSPGAKPATALVAGALAGLVVFGVRRWPAPILVLLGLFGVVPKVPTGLVIPCMLVVLGVLAYRYSWRAAGIGWAFTYLVMLANAGFFMPPKPTELLQAFAEAGLAAAPVAFGRYLRGVHSAAAVAEERLAETEAWRHAETRAAQLAERTRLAHDLHDIVAHHVGAMTLRASSGQLAVDTSGDVALASTALADIADTGRQVLSELRGLLAVLHDPDAIGETAMVTEPKAAISDAVARVRAAGVPITFDLDPGLDGTSLLVRSTAARIVQEALTNVLKHAGPGTATRLVATIETPHTLRLRIDNDPPAGTRLAAADLPASGHGLAGMRDRVALLGGVLTAGPTTDGGWAVSVALPAPPALAESTATSHQ
jgi:signal transduction histidine kinase